MSKRVSPAERLRVPDLCPPANTSSIWYAQPLGRRYPLRHGRRLLPQIFQIFEGTYVLKLNHTAGEHWRPIGPDKGTQDLDYGRVVRREIPGETFQNRYRPSARQSRGSQSARLPCCQTDPRLGPCSDSPC